MARRREKKQRPLHSRSRGGLPLSNRGLPKNLQKINDHAAGIDVGSRQHCVAVADDCDEDCVRTFGTFTADLAALADWLQACGVTTVAMESTGVYWIPVYEMLEERGFEVKLVEPRQLKHAPGRKTDVLDCQWIQQLHSYGLLSGSFRPEDQICVLRSYMRQRDMLVRQAATHVHHMQKALMEMNVQLHHVLNDITGVTGRKIIDAILAGERDPEKLASFRHGRCKHDEATIAAALEGNWRDDHLFALRQAVDLFRFYHQKMAELDEQIEAHLKTFEDKSDGQVLPRRRPQRKHNEPKFDMRNLLYQMTGVDLTSVDGIGAHIALGLIAEIGKDMKAWPTEGRFCSWLTLCPGNHKTGGKQHKGKTKTRTSSNRAAHLFRLAAQSLSRADCALGAYFRRMKARLGAPKATVATAHKIARIVYNLLRHGKEYVDRGAGWYESQYRERMLRGLQRRADQLGLTLVSKPALE